MHSSSIWRVTTLLVVFGAAALTTPAQQDTSQPSSGDPVADAARKARVEQKKEPKPKKVFTNDDIPSAPAASTAPAPSKEQTGGTQSAEAISGKKEETKDEKKKGEAYWRKRFGEVHQKIAETQQELDILQRELNKDQVQYYTDPQKALMQQHDRSDINEKNAKISAKKKELDALNQKLSDMEDELRKSGGDPGWAR